MVITAVLIIAYVGVPKIDEFSSFRLTFWKDNIGLNLSSSNLFGGTGLGKASRKIVAPKDTRDYFQLTRKFHVDNFYVETLIEFGAVGLLLYLMFLFLVYKKLGLRRTLKANRTCCGNDRRVFNLYNHAMACFVTLVVYGVFDSTLITTGNIISIYCWFIVMSYISTKKSTFSIQGAQDAKV
jgi:O-antigen ligase